MTIFHVINFAIPIGAAVFLGYKLDRMCKPEAAKEKEE